jgi:hypothetical protein
MWPIRPEQITLRACEDFAWRVMVCCPQCGYSVGVNTRILAGSKFGDVAAHRLLERAVFKCRNKKRGCDGVPAERVSITCIDVGMSKTLAEWTILPGGSSARLVKCELPEGGRPI